MVKPIIMQMDERGYYTVLPDVSFPIDIENKTGIKLDIEITTYQQGRVSIRILKNNQTDLSFGAPPESYKGR